MKVVINMNIDWANPKSEITAHFTVGDACMLHMYNRLATSDDGMNTDKLIALCAKLEEIRTFLGVPMNVHCMYRSPAYNLIIKAPEHDVHSMSMACDFDCLSKMTCDEVKEKLLPQLENLGIRMENNGKGVNWVHIDMHEVIHERYFTP